MWESEVSNSQTLTQHSLVEYSHNSIWSPHESLWRTFLVQIFCHPHTYFRHRLSNPNFKTRLRFFQQLTPLLWLSNPAFPIPNPIQHLSHPISIDHLPCGWMISIPSGCYKPLLYHRRSRWSSSFEGKFILGSSCWSISLLILLTSIWSSSSCIPPDVDKLSAFSVFVDLLLWT